MKIKFQITKIEERTNNVDDTKFYSLSLLKEKKVEEQGIVTTAKLYASMAVQSIAEGVKEFIFDSESMNMVEREYVVDGVTKKSNSIYFKAQ